jgi:hypothetical protein
VSVQTTIPTSRLITPKIAPSSNQKNQKKVMNFRTLQDVFKLLKQKKQSSERSQIASATKYDGVLWPNDLSAKKFIR